MEVPLKNGSLFYENGSSFFENRSFSKNGVGFFKMNFFLNGTLLFENGSLLTMEVFFRKWEFGFLKMEIKWEFVLKMEIFLLKMKDF